MLDLKFFDEYYVGFAKDRGTEDQLGFAVPIDATSAYDKRKATVDQWRNKEVEPITIRNAPSYGFKITDSITRYQTSNKVFRIFDPRGFELEISAENLFDLISRCTLSRGTISEKMLWGRTNTGKNYLIPENSQEYEFHLKGPQKLICLPGTYFQNKAGNIIYRYEGKFFKAEKRARVTKWPHRNYSSYYNTGVAHHEITVTFTKDTKPWEVYTFMSAKYRSIETKREKIKNLLPYSGELPETSNQLRDTHLFFSSREEMAAYFLPKDEAEQLAHNCVSYNKSTDAVNTVIVYEGDIK